MGQGPIERLVRSCLRLGHVDGDVIKRAVFRQFSNGFVLSRLERGMNGMRKSMGNATHDVTQEA